MCAGLEHATDGDDAADLVADLGMVLFPWERYVLGRWLARDPFDRFSYLTCGLSVPRQNGKNAVIEAYELYLLAVCGMHVLHTAHRVKTAKKSFQRLVKYFKDDRHPELKSMVEKIRYTNGEEAIYLANGGSIEFSARSNSGGRGYDDIQAVVFDEAQELTDPQLSAIMYTLSASSTGERQMIFTGTPPDPTCPGTVFRKTRASATAGDARKTCWIEWGIEEPPKDGAAFDSVVDAVYDTNPSMGFTLDEDFTRVEFDTSSLAAFCIERLGWWIPSAAEGAAAIPAGLWGKTAIPAIGGAYRARKAFGLKFSPDGTRYYLAGCKLDAKGDAAVELVEIGTTENGTRPLASALVSRADSACCTVVDGISGAAVLCDHMRDMKAPKGYVVEASASTVISAASLVLDGLKDGTLAHASMDGSQAELDDSATTSVKRPIGTKGGWGFGSADGHDSCAIEAASLALWGAKNSKRRPGRKQRRI